ncbi:hypothetical protein LguiB_009153 [Lonicera macranthoides]
MQVNRGLISCFGAGGLLLAALVHKEGTFLIFMAELLTIAKEFALIVEIGMSEMVFESDSKTQLLWMLQALDNNRDASHGLFNLADKKV